jgi:hypothetical protein
VISNTLVLLLCFLWGAAWGIAAAIFIALEIRELPLPLWLVIALWKLCFQTTLMGCAFALSMAITFFLGK